MPKIDLDAIQGPIVLLQEPNYQGDMPSSRLCTVLRREGDCLLVHVKNGHYHAELDADGGFHPLKLGVTRGVYARMWEDQTPALYEVAWQGDLPFDPSDHQRAIEFIEATIESQGVDWQTDPAPAPAP